MEGQSKRMSDVKKWDGSRQRRRNKKKYRKWESKIRWREGYVK